MNPVIGKITCPLCGNASATVHAQQNRGNKKYFRCYNGEHGDCGTIQCTGAGGQRFISLNMRAVKGEQLTEVVEDAKQAAKQETVKAAHQGQKIVEKNQLGNRQVNNQISEPEEKPQEKPKRRSMLRALLEDE